MASSIVEKFHSMEYGPAPEDPGEVNKWLDAHQRSSATSSTASGPRSHLVRDEKSCDRRSPRQGRAGRRRRCRPRRSKAARAALPEWQALTGHQRARYLYAFARQVQRHSRRLAVLESLDNGKPIRESRDIDIPLVARHFYHHAGWAQLLGDLTRRLRGEEFRGYTPVGVVGQIIPWNFPLLMLAWKIAPALAVGNTVVIKPAEFTPLTAHRSSRRSPTRSALPKGVLNVINGDGRPAPLSSSTPTSTRSPSPARPRSAASSARPPRRRPRSSPSSSAASRPSSSSTTPISTRAVEGLVDGIWFNQGQVCCAGSRLLVQERVAEKLFDKIRARMETLRVGSPLDKAIDIGAIVDQVQFDRIQKLVAMGIAEGATCWQPEIPMPKNGLFLKPTLLTDVHPSSTVAQQEIFGPVLASMTFRTPAEAVELANNTPYGLAACVWSENINVALDVAAQVKAGVVWVNSTNLFDAACGFGGYRESGYGREGGKEGMFEYLVPAWTHAAHIKQRSCRRRENRDQRTEITMVQEASASTAP